MTPDQEQRLTEIFMHSESDLLTQWERDRLAEWGTEYERHGSNYYLSQRQWQMIAIMEEKLFGERD
jgi:hypothetical protein